MRCAIRLTLSLIIILVILLIVVGLLNAKTGATAIWWFMLFVSVSLGISYLIEINYRPTYWYKDKPYKILTKSKIKLGGEWQDVIIYKTKYKNPDGKIWVRLESEFIGLFKTKT